MLNYDYLMQEQQFVLRHVAGCETYGLDEDVIRPVLDGVGKLAAKWERINRVGDEVGARWTSVGVEMPDGFKDAYEAYVEAGWGSLGVSEAFGGQGMPFVLQTAVLETLGTANSALALLPTLSLGAMDALVHHGSTEQQQRYLPRLASGEWTSTMNLTEPQAGSDVGALRTRATPRSDGKWNIAGQKIFISYGDHDLAENIIHLVLARTPDAPPGTRGISLFVVPKFRLDEDGQPAERNDVRVVSIEHKMGLHASPTCVMSFGDEGDCIGELVGRIGGGMSAMFTMMNSARLNVGLQGIEIAEAATQKAVAFALQRIQSARTGAASRDAVAIVEHPDVRRMLLRMKAQTQAARALVYYAAGMVDAAAHGAPDAAARLELLTPLAKAHATDLGMEVASLGIQVHGGVGYVEETGAAQFFRDARIMPIYEGTNGIQAADLVGRKLSLEQGQVFQRLVDDMARGAVGEQLQELVGVCRTIGSELTSAHHDDRLAASSPFLTMLSVAVCGWLMERQAQLAGDDAFGRSKKVAARFYVEQIVPEALGLRAAATASSDVLYALDSAELAA
jgi:alkylation response protein AidB-like acyl-CoA dehydrogenase